MHRERVYDIDKSVLSKKYRDVMRYLHPDLHMGMSTEGMAGLHDVVNIVNSYYAMMKDDVGRGNILLNLHGFDGISEDSSFDQSDIEFVEEMFDVSEQIEESSSLEELREIMSSLKGKHEDLYRVLRELFEGRKYDQVKVILAKLNVVNKKIIVVDRKISKETEDV